jgi:hypothetical protein
MNRERRQKIVAIKKTIETLCKKVALIHEKEYEYRETLWVKGKDESDTADVSDDALDALSKAETALINAGIELKKVT